MSFPLDIKYIKETEKELNVEFPESFISKMLNENGGEISTEEDFWEVYPFSDKSNQNTISRTCNDIIYETKEAQKWKHFPTNAIAIANNGFGDQMILLLIDGHSRKLRDEIYMWFHETSEVTEIAKSIIDLIEE